MQQHVSPYICHLFVCTNTRNGERKSCGDDDTSGLKTEIKAEIKNRGWTGTVRVSESGCLGICDTGPNIMLYPQKIWFSGVSREDLSAIIQAVERILLDVENVKDIED